MKKIHRFLIISAVLLTAFSANAQMNFEWQKSEYNPINNGLSGMHPNAVISGNTIHVFYDPGSWPGQRINYAFSTDSGQTWDDQGTVIHPADFGLGDMSTGTVMFEDGLFHLYYSAVDWQWREIGYATSPDGYSWTNHGIILQSGESGEWDYYNCVFPKVFRDSQGNLRMIYLGNSGGQNTAFGLATFNENTQIWEKYSGNPIMTPGGGPDNFDNYSVHFPGSAFYSDDGLYYFFYSGFDTGVNPPGKIDMGWATSADMINWQKHGRVNWVSDPQPWEGNEIYSPNVIPVDDGFTMFYARYRSNFAIGMAHSQMPLSSISIAIDIKPGSCPNPLKVSSRGVIPVAILGSEFFDVTEIDVASVLLGDVSPIPKNLNPKDVAAPNPDPLDECDCDTLGADGFIDKVFLFDAQEVASSLGEIQNGDIITLTLTGLLNNSVRFEGIDCVLIRKKCSPGFSQPKELPIQFPEYYAVSRAYPNPFNAQTTFEYALPEASHVTIEIYDLLGRKIATLIDAEQHAGYHSITWDATDQASGMYFYQIQAGEFTETNKMTLLK